MAVLTLTHLYANLNGFPGNLLAASDGVSIETRSATAYSYTYVAGSPFAGYRVTSTGTDFAYDGATPTGGTMTGLAITDPVGNKVLTVSGIAPTDAAANLALFAADQFGWTDAGGGGPGAQIENAWSLLLAGNDHIKGTSGDDTQGLIGANSGDDLFDMGKGNDLTNGGLGNDTIHGDEGWDTLTFDPTHWIEGIAMTRGITVNVDAGTVLDPYGATDHFTGLEHIVGSALNDVFYGGSVQMNFDGNRGSDMFYAGTAGDWIAYGGDTWLGGNRGIVAKLGIATSGADILGTIKDGFGSLDHTVNVQNVDGTRYDDRFFGNALANMFTGGEGEDSYDGRGGSDNVVFENGFSDAAQHGITVDLTLSTGQIVDDGFGNTETAISIEGVIGSRHGDTIIGSGRNNWIKGGEGDDTITGGGGQDTFQWRSFSELGGNDIITDFHAGSGARQDRFHMDTTSWGGTSTLHLVNGPAATEAVDTFVMNPVTHTLFYDPDGTGSDPAIKIVVLQGVTSLSAANFDPF